MTILWGDTFPKMHFLTRYTQSDTKSGDGSTAEFSITLSNTPVEKNLSEFVVTYTSDGAEYTETFIDDGNGNLTSDLGGTGDIDYSSGAVTLKLSHIPDSGAEIRIDSTYYEVTHNVDLTAPDLYDVLISWLEVKEYELMTFSGTVKKSKKYRGRFTLFAESVDTISTLDWLRLAHTWRNEMAGRKLVLFPRPNYLGGFLVYAEGEFTPTYPVENKWVAQKVKITFLTENVFSEIPTHTGGVCDVVE